MNILSSQLYTLIKKEETQALIILGDESHPIFHAHFEGNPILPAFLQVDIVAEIFNLNVIGITRSKFMKPLKPLDEVLIRLEKSTFGIKAKLLKDEQICCEMNLEIK